MRPPTAIAVVTAGGLCAAVFLAGCSSAGSRRWLSYFFDGVPTQTGQGQKAAGRGPAATNAAATKPGLPVSPAPVQPVVFIHKPYAQEDCLVCHESRFAVEMRAPLKEVCMNCHKELAAKAAPKSSHQPYNNGECASCHNPHYSANKHLLVKSAKTLCADCHDPMVAKPKSSHQPYDDGECLSCHVAHASANKFLLVRTGKALCFDCHDDFLAKAKFKHDPAGNGECESCHNPHASANNKLLVKEAQKLCFDCHEEKDIAAAKGHRTWARPPVWIATIRMWEPTSLLKPGKSAANPPAPSTDEILLPYRRGLNCSLCC